MTAQAADLIAIDGQQWLLLASPLDDWLTTLPRLPLYIAPHTANRRGYVASWEIVGDRLLLVGIEASVESATGEIVELTGPEALGGHPLPVQADFVTGQFRVGRGAVVRYVHAGFESRYDEELLLEVDQGRVVATRRLGQVGEMGSAGPYLLHEPLLGFLSGGAFGQLIAGTAPGGHPVVAKVARARGGGPSSTVAPGRDGGLPWHQPAFAFGDGDGDGGIRIREANAAQLRAVLVNEAAILERDGGRLLPLSHGLWEHDPSGQAVLVMELLEGARVSRPEQVADLLDALAEAVERGTFDCHGDVKYEHIFIADGGRVRLCDPAPRFVEHGWHGRTPLYNPLGYTGPAADVAACATLLRHLPDTTAGWRWIEDVLRGPHPPAWAASHRTAVAELRDQLAHPEAPPPDYPTVPRPADDGSSTDGSHADDPDTAWGRTWPPADPVGTIDAPLGSPFEVWPSFDALALAVRASVLESTGDEGQPLFIELAATAEQSLQAVLDAVAVTLGRLPAGLEADDPPAVTLVLRPATWGPARGVSAAMVSMVPVEESLEPSSARAAADRAWNLVARLDLGAALTALGVAARLAGAAPGPDVVVQVRSTLLHIASILATLIRDHRRFLDGDLAQ